MAVKLGDDDVSFRFGGIQVDAIYLGTEEVWSAVPAGPATLYFDGAVNNDWTTVGNWWLDDGHTQAAGRLPAQIDSVVATESITASGQTVLDFTLNGSSTGLSGTLTVTGIATFNDFSFLDGTITGNATFNDGSGNEGTVTGNSTFNDNSYNIGTVTGTATFTGFACNSGTVDGSITGDPPSC
jgi:hypothetical protein